GRAEKLSNVVLAFSLYKTAPAEPFAAPNRSELEKPPTAPINWMSSGVARPEIKSVICTSLTSKPAKYMALAISLSEFDPFARMIAALGLVVPFEERAGFLPSNCVGKTTWIG